ncbi:MAG: tetratricopeptide repeat protein [Bacteroidetes bacterium]|nr:tetratricopeptide repeat protein [Bacteroidota bacterium]
MAKQKNNPDLFIPEIKPYTLFPFHKPIVPYLILGLLAFIFYINTIYNEFALDDGIIIHKNEYVMQGVAGIDSIMSRDAYHSFYKQMNAKAQLAGGRYRPLSVVSFAIEQEFIGKYPDGHLPPANCWDDNGNGKGDVDEDINGDGLYNDNDCLTKGCMLRHFNNMLFYLISILLIYAMFKNHLFTKYPDMAFVAALLFCIHPLHTEVVANMKSRDEIFSMIFIPLTFINVFKYAETRQMKHMIWAAFNYFLALLSKEYAVTLIMVIPATLYLVDDNFTIKKYSTLFIFLAAALMVYFKIRFSIVVAKTGVPDTELLNNPYLLADKKHHEITATKIFVWLKYLILLFFPYILSSDYSYNSIPYRRFTSPEVWLSLFIYISLAYLAFKLFRKRHPAAWGLIFFFANFLMIANLLIDIGATMGERLIFHSSLGWAMCIAWVFTEEGRKYIKDTKVHKTILWSVLIVLTILFGIRTITRNAIWKNDITLFTHDVDVMPNSVLCLGNAGARWIDLSERPENKKHETEYLKKAQGYLTHALELHPKYVNGYLNLGLSYFKLRDYNKAEEIWGIAQRLYPSNPYLVSYYRVLSNVYIQQAFADAKDKKMQNSLYWFDRASKIFPQDPEIWYNLGGVAFSLGDYARARAAFEKCLQLNPNHQNAKTGLANCPVVPAAATTPVTVPGQQPVTQMPPPPVAIAETPKTLSVSSNDVMENTSQKLPKMLNGYYVLYNQAHQKTKDGVFKNNRFMEGKNFIYNSSGQLSEIDVYKDGVFIGTSAK